MGDIYDRLTNPADPSSWTAYRFFRRREERKRRRRCHKCGTVISTVISERSKFCPKCGAQLKTKKKTR